MWGLLACFGYYTELTTPRFCPLAEIQQAPKGTNVGTEQLFPPVAPDTMFVCVERTVYLPLTDQLSSLCRLRTF